MDDNFGAKHKLPDNIKCDSCEAFISSSQRVYFGPCQGDVLTIKKEDRAIGFAYAEDIGTGFNFLCHECNPWGCE